MLAGAPYRVAFFDIGDTLGRVSVQGNALQLQSFASTQKLLESFGSVLGLRLGIITNSGPFSTQDILDMLKQSGLIDFFEPKLVITSAAARVTKPDTKIHEFAAAQAATAIGQCIFIGDETNQVTGAERAGMGGVLKPVQP